MMMMKYLDVYNKCWQKFQNYLGNEHEHNLKSNTNKTYRANYLKKNLNQFT